MTRLTEFTPTEETMKYLVVRSEIETALRAAGHRSSEYKPLSLRLFNERGGWYPAPEDETSVVIDVSENPDGTWGWGGIPIPPSAIRLDD